MEAQQCFYSMNSVMYVYVDCDKQAQADDLIFQIIKTVGKFERKWSCFEKGSVVSRLNRSKDRWMLIEKDTFDLLKKSCEYSLNSKGNFSLFSGVYASVWKDAILNEKLPDDQVIKNLIGKQKNANLIFKWRLVKPNDNDLIDLGGCAKGYIAQYIKDKFENLSYLHSLFLNLGGNIITYSRDESTSDIKIINPITNQDILLEKIKNISIVTSGDYIQNFRRDGKLYHHIIDMNTGYPADSPFCSVTVIGDDSFLCDCRATDFYVRGNSAMEECNKNHIAAIFILKNGDVLASESAKKFI